MVKQLPSTEQLRDLFSYNILTGRLHWRISRGKAKAGKQAGCTDSHGYYRLRYKGVDYLASRIIYKWVTGHDPSDLTIDHIDNNPINDCFWNLRLATPAQQIQNRRLNATGVCLNGTSYLMRIMIRGNRICKTFSTYEEARLAYEDAKTNHPDVLP